MKDKEFCRSKSANVSLNLPDNKSSRDNARRKNEEDRKKNKKESDKSRYASSRNKRDFKRRPKKGGDKNKSE